MSIGGLFSIILLTRGLNLQCFLGSCARAPVLLFSFWIAPDPLIRYGYRVVGVKQRPAGRYQCKSSSKKPHSILEMLKDFPPLQLELKGGTSEHHREGVFGVSWQP